MIHELYESAAVIHGHKCPGLAIGVRAAAEAKRILEAPGESLSCVAEKNACFIDGIRSVAGCTEKKGRLSFNITGKVAFTFTNNASGKTVRLDFVGNKPGLSREEQIEYILTAPLDEIFAAS